MNWYGENFEADRTISDYPHNPFLSVLLYSGIIGLMFYLALFYKTVKYYFQCFKDYGVLFLCFCITFFITFFSGATPFDPPVMGFFVILPFFIHSISQKNPDNA
jgi:O-antigen ligase